MRALRGVATARLLTAALLWAAVACSASEVVPPQPPPAAPVEDDERLVLRWALGAPRVVLPGDAVTDDDLLVTDALFDSLTRWDAGLQPRPAVAATWTPSEDARTWTFRLGDTTYSDGTPVVAGDFVAAWTYAARHGAASHHLREVAGYAALRAGRSSSLAGVRALDARLLRVRLRRPWADFPAVVAHPALAPLPAAVREANTEAYALHPVGNGPFRLVSPASDSGTVALERWTGWRGWPSGNRAGDEDGPPEGLLLQRFDPATGYLALQQGRIDVAAVPPGALAEARREFARAPGAYRGPGLMLGRRPSVYLLAFDVRQPPWDEAVARQAVSRALHRARIAAAAFEGNADPARTATPAPLPGGGRVTCAACVANPGQARLALAEAGVDELVFAFDRGGGHELVAELLADDLALVGVRLRPLALSFDSYLAALGDNGDAVIRFGWTPDYPMLDNVLYPLFHSRQTPEAGGANYAGYAEPQVDALLDRARATLDRARREQLYQRAEALAVGRDQVVVPLLSYRHRLAVGDRVTELRYGPMGDVDWGGVRLRPTVDERPPPE